MTYTDNARAAAKHKLDQQLRKREVDALRPYERRPQPVTPAGQIIESFQALPLTTRIRVVAEVLVDVNNHRGTVSYTTWNPTTLMQLADKLDAEDAMDKQTVEELANDLYNVTVGQDMDLETCRDAARQLIADGWNNKKETDNG
jgi:hypothetical protein